MLTPKVAKPTVDHQGHIISPSDLTDWLLGYCDRPSEGSLYALIDGTGNDGTLADFFRNAADADYCPLFLNTDYQGCLPRSPYLAKLDARHRDYLISCTTNYFYRDAVWVISELDLPSMANHWRALTMALLPDEDLVLFRYWSGTILEQLLHSLPASEQRALLPPLKHIVTPNTKGNGWRQRSFRPKPNNPYPEVRQCRFSASQLAELELNDKAVVIQIITDRLWRTQPQLMAKQHPRWIEKVISDGFDEAHELGIKGEAALLKFIQCKLTIHPEFWRQHQLAAIWHQANSDKRFLEFCRNLSVGV